MEDYDDPFKKRKNVIVRVLQEATHEQDVQILDGGDHADLASTISFALAKKQKTSPVRIAQDLVKIINDNPEFQATGARSEAAGPYINFKLDTSYLAESLQAAVQPGYGSLTKKGIRVVLEHTSANPNGPLHVGHIRNSIIGDTLARVFRKAGLRT